MKALRERLAQISRAPFVVAAVASPILERRARKDLTTKRGNVPSFGPEFGDVPVRVSPRPQAIVVQGPHWAIDQADKKGKVDEWVDLVADVARKALDE